MHTKTKLLIYLALWKRPEITEICFMGIERMKQHPDYDISVLAVLSEDTMKPLCEKYGVQYVECANEPLGAKKNFGLQACKAIDFDYLMEIGSDDLILNELLDDYKSMLGKDFFGIVDAAYINSEDLACRRLTSRHSRYGAGRMFSRSLLEKYDFKIWPDNINRAMDNNSWYRIVEKDKHQYHVSPVKDFPRVIDIKSDVNLWPFNYLNGNDYSIDEVFSRLSEREVNAIKCLQREPVLES